MRIGLVGCVKSKRGEPCAAEDLYTSALFRGRRAYVERTCDLWFVLSAKYGLVARDAVVRPYDATLTSASRQQRRAWATQVLADLALIVGPLNAQVFELHAGAAYIEHGLESGLRASGAVVEVPAAGLSLGKQLAFYKRGGAD